MHPLGKKPLIIMCVKLSLTSIICIGLNDILTLPICLKEWLYILAFSINRNPSYKNLFGTQASSQILLFKELAGIHKNAVPGKMAKTSLPFSSSLMAQNPLVCSANIGSKQNSKIKNI
jgi:hypothetical protein